MQIQVSLLDPADNRGVMNFGDSLDSSEAHAVEVHLQAQLSHIVAVAPVGLRIRDELATTTAAAVVLLSASEPVL